MTIKELLIQTINEQPDDSSYEEIFKQLLMRKSIDAGLEQSIKGQVKTEQEIDIEIDSW
jgi:hypothetical protein